LLVEHDIGRDSNAVQRDLLSKIRLITRLEEELRDEHKILNGMLWHIDRQVKQGKQFVPSSPADLASPTDFQIVAEQPNTRKEEAVQTENELKVEVGVQCLKVETSDQEAQTSDVIDFSFKPVSTSSPVYDQNDHIEEVGYESDDSVICVDDLGKLSSTAPSRQF
jgi:hypothetical protein